MLVSEIKIKILIKSRSLEFHYSRNDSEKRFRYFKSNKQFHRERIKILYRKILKTKRRFRFFEINK